jgi:hypothetical protein
VQDLGGAAHDRVGPGVAEGPAHPAGEAGLGQQGVGTEHPGAEHGDPLLHIGAEGLGRGGEAGRGLAEDLAQHEEAADAEAGLEVGPLLAHDRIGRVGQGHDRVEQGLVGHEAVDAAPLVLELAHDLAEAAVQLADEVLGRHLDVLEVHLVEVAVAGDVGDRHDRDARGVERHHELGHPLVGRGIRVGPADQVDVVGEVGARGPDLLAGHPERVALPHRLGADAGQVRPGVGLAHPDGPALGAVEDAGEVAVLLLGRAELDQRGTHLPVGEPGVGQRRAGRDELLGHEEPVDRGPPAAADLGRPGHPEPAPPAQLHGELAVDADHPGVLGDLGASRCRPPHLAGLGLQGELLVGQREVHRSNLTAPCGRAHTPVRSAITRGGAGRGPAAQGTRTYLPSLPLPANRS